MGTFLGILLIVTIVLSKVVSKKLADAGEGRMPEKSVGRKLSDPFPKIEIPPAPQEEDLPSPELQEDISDRDNEFMEVLKRYAGLETAAEPYVPDTSISEPEVSELEIAQREVVEDAGGDAGESSGEAKPVAPEMETSGKDAADLIGKPSDVLGKKTGKLEIDPKKMVIYSELIRPKYLD